MKGGDLKMLGNFGNVRKFWKFWKIVEIFQNLKKHMFSCTRSNPLVKIVQENVCFSYKAIFHLTPIVDPTRTLYFSGSTDALISSTLKRYADD